MKPFSSRNWRENLVGFRPRRVGADRSDDYQDRAADCIVLASVASSEYDRLALLNMAQSWLELAKQAEKNSKVDVWYETPLTPPRRKAAQ